MRVIGLGASGLRKQGGFETRPYEKPTPLAHSVTLRMAGMTASWAFGHFAVLFDDEFMRDSA